MMTMRQDEIMTVKVAAAYLRVNTTTLYRLANRGDIPAFRLGGGWRFSRTELGNWIRRQGGTAR